MYVYIQPNKRSDRPDVEVDSDFYPQKSHFFLFCVRAALGLRGRFRFFTRENSRENSVLFPLCTMLCVRVALGLRGGIPFFTRENSVFVFYAPWFAFGLQLIPTDTQQQDESQAW